MTLFVDILTSHSVFFSWETLLHTLEEKQHLQHNSDSNKVVHHIKHVNDYGYIQICVTQMLEKNIKGISKECCNVQCVSERRQTATLW